MDAAHRPEALLSPNSALRNSKYWNDLVKLLAETFRLTTKELSGYTDQSVNALRDELRADEVLYSNISRRLRTDMRIDRERFGHLRDGVR